MTLCESGIKSIGDIARLRSLTRIAFLAARGIIRNEEDAKDVSQGAMAALVARAHLPPDNPEAWVTRVAQNTARALIKRRQTLQRILDNHGEIPDSQEFVDRVIARILLDDVLEELPPRQRQALRLRFEQDLSQAKVAEVMGIAIETVKTHVERARSSARGRWNEWDPEEV